MTVYWLLGLAPLAAAGVIFWAYRKKSAAQAAAREARVALLLQGASAPEAPPESAILDTPADTAGGPSALPYGTRDRFLAPRHAVLYYLLKSALPDHDVHANVSLAAVIEVAPGVTGAERDGRRRAVSQITIDFLVCDKRQHPVAAIDIAAAAVDETTFKSECLKAAGLRYVRADATRLPRRHDVRAWALGEG